MPEDALYEAVACLPDYEASTTGRTGHIEDAGFEAVMKPNGGGEISFGASGFSQALRAEPVLTDEQRLSPADRA